MRASWPKEAYHSSNNGEWVSELTPGPLNQQCRITLVCSSTDKDSSIFSMDFWVFLKQFPTRFDICHVFSSASFCHFCYFLSFSGLWRHPPCLRRSSINITSLDAVMSREGLSLPYPTLCQLDIPCIFNFRDYWHFLFLRFSFRLLFRVWLMGSKKLYN